MSDERCGGCPHPPHLGLCDRRNGQTAYACGCLRSTPAPPREGHALGLLEETESLCLEVAAVIRPAGWDLAGQTVMAVIQGLNLLAKKGRKVTADASSPVGELRTWQQERADVVACLGENIRFLERQVLGDDMCWEARCVRLLRAQLEDIERGDHVGASQETAEKETGRG